MKSVKRMTKNDLKNMGGKVYQTSLWQSHYSYHVQNHWLELDDVHAGMV